MLVKSYYTILRVRRTPSLPQQRKEQRASVWAFRGQHRTSVLPVWCPQLGFVIQSKWDAGSGSDLCPTKEALATGATAYGGVGEAPCHPSQTQGSCLGSWTPYLRPPCPSQPGSTEFRVIL